MNTTATEDEKLDRLEELLREVEARAEAVKEHDFRRRRKLLYELNQAILELMNRREAAKRQV